MLRLLITWGGSLGIGALFAFWTLQDWPVGTVLSDVHLNGLSLVWRDFSLHLLWLPVYFLTLVSMHVFRVWRWKPLLEPVVRVDIWTLNRVSSVGFLAMFLLPVRLGELVRPALLSTEVQVRRSPALATVVVERTVDGVLVAGFLAIALVFLPRANLESYTELRWATYLALLLFAALVALLILVFVFRRRIAGIAHVLAPKISGRRVGRAVAGVLDRFLQGLAIFPDWKNFLKFLAGSLGYWGSNCTGLYLLAHGFDLGIPFAAAVAMMATIVVGMMIPNPPGNVGTFWFFLLKPLELYGLAGQPAALAFALAVYLMQLMQLVLFAGWFLARGRVPWRRAFSVKFRDLANGDAPDSRAVTVENTGP